MGPAYLLGDDGGAPQELGVRHDEREPGAEGGGRANGGHLAGGEGERHLPAEARLHDDVQDGLDGHAPVERVDGENLRTKGRGSAGAGAARVQMKRRS